MQQGCPQPHEEVPSALETLLLESASYLSIYLAAQSAATCSCRFFAGGFLYLKLEAIRSSETSVHTRTTRRHIPENDVLHSHRRENLKPNMVFICLRCFLLPTVLKILVSSARR
jgi:hypothetical protein